LAQDIIDNKVIPNKECFNGLFDKKFKNTKSEHRGKLKNSALRKSTDEMEYDKITQLIELFVNNGYSLDYADIVTATKHHYEIENIDRFNIKIKKDFALLCSRESFYPKYMPTNVNKTLEIECNKQNNYARIKYLINADYKPDVNCLNNACKYKNNHQVIELLLKNGVVPTLGTLIKITNTINNKSLSTLMCKYVETLKNSNKDTENNNI